MGKVDQIAERFNNHAHNYDNRWTTWLGERELRGVRQLVPANSRVLDYGCGTGRTTLDLLQRGCQVTAYDISSEMLKQARLKTNQKGYMVEFTCDPAHLQGRTWPVVTCIGVMEYYPDPVPMLESLSNYLAPNGTLVITFPNLLNPLGWLYYLGSRFTVPARPFLPAKARHACLKAGFEIERLIFTVPAISPFGYTMVINLARI
jgi:2-polyprenyl-3-methyl-5-hydroxy-6-metoxy-1,4-benzoquinol methylase